jgi:hypothetical protein
LGAKLQEELRRYLLGAGPFPSRAKVFVQVWTNLIYSPAIATPISERVDGVWRHKLTIPGMTIAMFVGSEAATRKDVGP